MANPNTTSYIQAGPPSQGIRQKELLIRLYLHQHMEGSKTPNQRAILTSSQPNQFGRLGVNDWTIREGPSSAAKIVARIQGTYAVADVNNQHYFLSDNMLFIDGQFNGSSLAFLGKFEGRESNWAIVGGTGEFACAQGVASYKVIKVNGPDVVMELNIRALFHTFPKQNPVIRVKKTGLSGGNGGDAFDISQQPGRLDSVTIRSGDVIDSIAFSYVDQIGTKQTAGPWGGDGGLSYTVSFAPTETVNKVFGTIGVFGTDTVVTSLTLVTNVQSYGPFGKESGTRFSIPPENNRSVVGLFARAGLVVDAIGAYYVEPSATN